MKILIIIGSHRRNGNTDQIIDLIKQNLQVEAEKTGIPLELETIYLSRQEIGFCRGCRMCYDRGEFHCPMKDDIHVVKAKMVEADGLLLASPVYVDDVSAIMKNYIDRFCHVCHRPQFAGKSAYLVATTGGTRTGKTLDTMKLALRTWGFHIAGQSGYKMGALMKREETKIQFSERAKKAANVLFHDIDQRKFLDPSFFELMVFKIQQLAWKNEGIPGTVDHTYWEQRDWFDPRRTFFIPIRSNWVKVKLARASGAVIALFVT
jgi:multimeric flavodoxin WrbA